MIRTLPVTILIEGIVVYAFAVWSRKPAGSLLLASLIVNLITQPILWITLSIFLRYYMTTFIAVEIFIGLAESLLMRRLSGDRLSWKTAVALSLCMNSASAGIGLWLPV